MNARHDGGPEPSARTSRVTALLLAVALASTACPPTTVDAVRPLPAGGGAGGQGAQSQGGDAAAGGNPLQGGGGAAPTCSAVPSGTSESCNGCRDGSCCSEAQACAAEPECLLWLECEEACDIADDVCLRNCWIELPASPSKAAYVACKHRECASSCSLTACSDPAFGYEDDAYVGECAACQREHCCPLYDTCLQDADCADLLECFVTSGGETAPCNIDEYLPAQMTFAPIFACRAEHCMTECVGADGCTTAWVWGEGCDSCANEYCCDEAYAATVDPSAVYYYDCVKLCDGNTDCEAECVAEYTVGAGLIHAYKYCRDSKCASACSFTFTPKVCGALVPSTMAFIDCKNCTDENCCVEGEACGTTAECAGLYICVDSCDGDAPCALECRATFTTAGTVPYDLLAACQAEHCAEDCG